MHWSRYPPLWNRAAQQLPVYTSVHCLAQALGLPLNVDRDILMRAAEEGASPFKRMRSKYTFGVPVRIAK
jgi:hypothetical protein